MNAKKLNTLWKKTYKYANVLLNIIETREKKIRNIKCKNTQLVTWIDKYLLGFVRLRACSLAFRCVTNTSFLRFCPFSYSFFCPVHRESANETVSNEKMGFFAVTYFSKFSSCSDSDSTSTKQNTLLFSLEQNAAQQNSQFTKEITKNMKSTPRSNRRNENEQNVLIICILYTSIGFVSFSSISACSLLHARWKWLRRS